MIGLALSLLLLAIVLSIVHWSVKNGISPMPSTQKHRSAILSLIPQTTQGQILELGSGWGTLAIAVARKFPHCKITGYENSPVPYYVSRCLRKLTGLSNLDFQRKDFLQSALPTVNTIVCYLHPDAMHKLKKKLESEGPPGIPVICNTFAFDEWKPEQVIQLNDLYRTRVYLYRIPG